MPFVQDPIPTPNVQLALRDRINSIGRDFIPARIANVMIALLHLRTACGPVASIRLLRTFRTAFLTSGRP